MANKSHTPLRRSSRLVRKPVSLRSDTTSEAPQPVGMEEKNTTDTRGKRKEPKLLINTKRSSSKSNFAMENKEFDSQKRHIQTVSGAKRSKQKRLKPEQKGKIPKRSTIGNTPTCSSTSEYEEQELRLKLIKTIRMEQDDENGIDLPNRFTDVAFLDENHILALDDKWQKLGQRVCCIRLDGSLVCDFIVPGYPWSVIILSPTEAVLSIRESAAADGLLWLTIDIDSKSIEIIKHLRLKTKPHGLSYLKNSEEILVSYLDLPFMSVLTRNGEELRKIPCEMGVQYRCLVLENGNILYVDFFRSVVRTMDQEGNITWSFQVFGPMCLETDSSGNIYVGSFRTGDLLKFDKSGNYLAKLHCGLNLCGVAIDRTSEKLITAQNNTLSVFELKN